MPTKTNEILDSREAFFRIVDIEMDEINCGDDRGGLYIHIFGGALFVPYNLMVLQEIANPGSSQGFEATVRKIVPILKSQGIRGQGVHSDEQAEHGNTFQIDNPSGGVGCGYGGLRGSISQLIYDKSDLIIGKARILQPELFETDDDLHYGHLVTTAHSKLASSSKVEPGRQVIRAAISEGAGVKIFVGNHVAGQGIINTVKDSSFHSDEALAAGLPAYDHDMWASNNLFSHISDALPFSPRQIEIASLIDVIGTMEALSAHDIAVR